MVWAIKKARQNLQSQLSLDLGIAGQGLSDRVLSCCPWFFISVSHICKLGNSFYSRENQKPGAGKIALMWFWQVHSNKVEKWLQYFDTVGMPVLVEEELGRRSMLMAWGTPNGYPRFSIQKMRVLFTTLSCKRRQQLKIASKFKRRAGGVLSGL